MGLFGQASGVAAVLLAVAVLLYGAQHRGMPVLTADPAPIRTLAPDLEVNEIP